MTRAPFITGALAYAAFTANPNHPRYHLDTRRATIGRHPATAHVVAYRKAREAAALGVLLVRIGGLK